MLSCVDLVWYLDLSNLTGHVMHRQFEHSVIVRSVHTVFMCFVFTWEETATCATYSINWSVVITEMKSVYSAVRTGSLTLWIPTIYIYVVPQR